ncbi:glutaminyl-tRNA synthetase [Anaerocolumna jejuensis DSM 15929]|uniref:Glutamine--tRNA ligase n=1 Tax=Anaerocolumna jejuensis DSM 15929 TaxID=1121322 RepID=A0A1M6VBZ1_9FIRM|nr:glutamine--tRNA ligase/YqeY domain fusion protein [Anaerocolumna jejuensis]SHK78978.1 glutaminyl-tRNA synthetase [Anaerocolumna jejuensis DSM 15929]
MDNGKDKEAALDNSENNPADSGIVSKNFIEQIIEKDIKEGHCTTVVTRFPPEPNGYLHIGHAKSILLNNGLAKEYGGRFNLRFDDTNPTKEKTEFVESIIADVKWIGGDYEDRLFFASDYFDQMYEGAVKLIKKGKAYVCDLTAEEIREYRGTLTEPGKESPYRNRTLEENLRLFEEMKDGRYEDGSKVLRAKIDMASPNINMRDPIIYRIARMTHHNTGDKWCIYPMYDFAHPIEDAIEGVTHSICTLEFEDHRPLYDWVVTELEYENPPRQIEFAKLYLTNVITGKRYIKKLVEEGIVDGWDDPRLVSISALRRRGFTPESIKMFMELCGVSKSQSSVDYPMLEYCIREDLKLKKPRVMAVLDPVKLVITNYPEDMTEFMEVSNNQENEEMGSRQVAFGRELYIDREDFKIDPPRKYFRLFPGNEVRLMNAYFVTCTGYVTDENGVVTEVQATYDPKTRSGSGFNERKVKGTIHWVDAKTSVKAEVRLYENIVDEEKGVYNEDGSLNLNPNSITVLKDCRIEHSVSEAKSYDSFQFLRHGYFCVDSKDSAKDNLVFNRIVSLKSSYKPE